MTTVNNSYKNPTPIPTQGYQYSTKHSQNTFAPHESTVTYTEKYTHETTLTTTTTTTTMPTSTTQTTTTEFVTSTATTIPTEFVPYYNKPKKTWYQPLSTFPITTTNEMTSAFVTPTSAITTEYVTKTSSTSSEFATYFNPTKPFDEKPSILTTQKVISTNAAVKPNPTIPNYVLDISQDSNKFIESDVERIFHAAEVDIVYMTGLLGKKHSTRFKLEWEVLPESFSDIATRPTKQPYIHTKPTHTLPTEEPTMISYRPELLHAYPTSCPPDWPANQKYCSVKYLEICTVPMFQNVLSGPCAKRQLMQNYHFVVSTFSRLAITGDGDRHCIYLTDKIKCALMDFSKAKLASDFITQLQLLSASMFESCGKGALRQKIEPILIKLKLFASKCPRPIYKKVTTPTPTTPMTTTTTSTTITTPTTTTTTTTTITTTTTTTTTTTIITTTTNATTYTLSTTISLSTKTTTTKTITTATYAPSLTTNGFCETSLYIEAANAYTLIDKNILHPFKAAVAFNALVKLIVELGDKDAKLPCDETYSWEGLVPCNMLDIPTGELACQMANRVETLFKYVSGKCSNQWNRANRRYMRRLKQASLPSDSATCPGVDGGYQVFLKSAAENCLLSEELQDVNVSQRGTGKFRDALANESVNPKFRGQMIRRYEPLLKLKGCDIFCYILYVTTDATLSHFYDDKVC